MLPLVTTPPLTPYFANAVAGLLPLTVPVFPLVAAFVYGNAPSWVAVARIVCVWNVYAIATWSVVNPLAATTRAILSRIASSAAAVPSSIPMSCDLPPTEIGFVNCRIRATVLRAIGLPVLSVTPSEMSTA